MKGRPPLTLRCPDCGRVMSKVVKGWECNNPNCCVIRVRCVFPKGKPQRVERASRPRAKPLSDGELEEKLRPYMIDKVRELLVHT